jgi:phosphate transport system permease protein
MTTVVTEPMSGSAGPAEPARKVRSAAVGADRVFKLTLRGAGLAVLVIMTTIGLFLFYRGSQALADAGPWKFITTQAWEPTSHNFGIATVLTGVALYISEYVPRRFRQLLINRVDLMAAVPSVVSGCGGPTSCRRRSSQ